MLKTKKKKNDLHKVSTTNFVNKKLTAEKP